MCIERKEKKIENPIEFTGAILLLLLFGMRISYDLIKISKILEILFYIISICFFTTFLIFLIVAFIDLTTYLKKRKESKIHEKKKQNPYETV